MSATRPRWFAGLLLGIAAVVGATAGSLSTVDVSKATTAYEL